MRLFVPGRNRWTLVATSVVIGGLAAAMYWLSFNYRPSVRIFPQLICGTLLVLVVLDLLSQTQTAAGRFIVTLFGKEVESETPAFQGTASGILWVAAFGVMVVLIGFLPSAFLYMLISMTVFGTARPLEAGIWAVGLTSVVWVFFEYMLGFTLYRGFLFGAFL